MKKRILKFFLFFLSFIYLFLPVYATNEAESLENFADMESLWNALPEGINQEELKNIFENDEKDFGNVFSKIIKDTFSLGITDGTKMLLFLLALILVSALYRSVKDSFGLKETESAFDFLFVLAAGLICFSALEDTISLVTTALSSIKSFFLASLPITTVLMTLSGSPSAGATLGASLNMVLGLTTTLTANVLTPLLHSLYALTITEGIGNCGVGSVLSFFKRTLKTLCVLFFTLVSALLSLNHALATAADTLSMRSVRFAAGNFIPVVGSLVGESARTLSSAFSLIKTKCGAICLVVLFYIILRPILSVAVKKIILNIASAVGEMLSDSYFTRFIKSVSALMDLLLAFMISESCYLIFYITLFLTNKGSF